MCGWEQGYLVVHWRIRTLIDEKILDALRKGVTFLPVPNTW
jgi:hypothetical protein